MRNHGTKSLPAPDYPRKKKQQLLWVRITVQVVNGDPKGT